MIGCKVMRTLASLEIEIMLTLGLPCYLSSSSVRCLKNVDEIIADSDDPYEAIRWAYLVRMDTESKPFEDPIETETPESPQPIAPPTCYVEETEGSGTFGARSMSSDSTAPLLPDHRLTHTTPVLVPSLRTNIRMAMRVLPMMSPSLSVGKAEVAAMPDLTFCKRFRSSYNSLPSPTFPLWKSCREDEDPATGDEGLAARDEGPGIRVESLGLGGDEVVPEGQQRAAPVVETAMGEPLGLGYEALRRREIALGEGRMPSVFEVGQNSRFIPDSERLKRESELKKPTLTTWIVLEDAPSIVPLPISSPMISLTVPSLVASPATAEAEGFLTELGAHVEMYGGLIHDPSHFAARATGDERSRYYLGVGEGPQGALESTVFSCVVALRLVAHDRVDTHFLIRIDCNLSGSGFTFLLAVATFFTGSRKLFCQWELL
nr:hypothetical protein [Tanacetum cinerariifolium]